jgi:hypothetical protein
MTSGYRSPQASRLLKVSRRPWFSEFGRCHESARSRIDDSVRLEARFTSEVFNCAED